MDRPSAAHKAILASLMIVSAVLPARAARLQKLRPALTELFVGFAIFAVMYLVLTLLTAPGH